ncbi:MAG: hypothetical protein ACYDAO_05745 [Thermoplasmataceae archaeon]
MTQQRNTVLFILIVSIIIGIISYFVLNFELSNYFAALEAVNASSADAAFISMGIATGIFCCTILFYPVFKNGYVDYDKEDFR